MNIVFIHIYHAVIWSCSDDAQVHINPDALTYPATEIISMPMIAAIDALQDFGY